MENQNLNWKDRYTQGRERRKVVRSHNMRLINLSYYALEWHFASLFGWAFGVGIMMLVAFCWILSQRFVPNIEPHLFVPWVLVFIRFYNQLDVISLANTDFLSRRATLFNMYFSFCAGYNLYLGITNKDYLSALIDSPWLYLIPYAKEIFNI